MRRINMTFSDDYFARLQENATKKGVSLVSYARDLVDIGLQVEETAVQQPATSSTKNNPLSCLEDTKALWENTLLSILETRSLIRYLVNNLENQSVEKRDAVLNTVKEKSKILVTELLKDK